MPITQWAARAQQPINSEELRAKLQAWCMPEPNSGCWIWMGAFNGRYGVASWRSRRWYAHRLSLVAHGGRTTEEDVVCHRCDVPLCINPAHLFAAPQSTNLADMRAKGRAPDGDRHGMAKLLPAQVIAIRADRRLLREIAGQYAISEATVSYIRNGKRWQCL